MDIRERVGGEGDLFNQHLGKGWGGGIGLSAEKTMK